MRSWTLPQRKEVARVTLPAVPAAFETDAGRADSPSHGIGVAPDGKTLWVTSIPNNAVYVYSLDDLNLIGQVALPALKLPGPRQPISAVANWVTFTPDGRLIYVSNAGLRSVSAIDTKAMKVVAVVPVGEVPKRINTMVIPDGGGSRGYFLAAPSFAPLIHAARVFQAGSPLEENCRPPE